MRDNHLHTYFSYDADANFEDYLDHFDGEIVTTEHFDLSNPYSGQDDVPNYEAYCKKIAELTETYGPRIKKGIEIGYYQPRENDILAYLADKDFDLKLLSVHHNGINDYLDDEVADMDKFVVIEEYLPMLEYAIGRVDAHVLAHFDYGFRKFDLSVEEMSQYEDQLRSIFQKMIDHNLAFELNSKSMYLYNHEHLYHYALELLRDLGYQKYSIGSDGHKLDHFRLEFPRIQALLDEFGITEDMIL